MKRLLLVMMAALGAALLAPIARAEPPTLDEMRRQALEAEDTRFKRTLDLAELCEHAGRLDEARRLYGEALALRPDNSDVMDSLLSVLRRLGDYAAQLPLCEKLAARRPGDPRLQMQTGECLWRLGRTEEARRTWEDLLRRFPSDRTVYDDLFDFYMGKGDRPLDAVEGTVPFSYDDALSLLAERRRRFPTDPDVLLMEARLALARKQPEAALPPLLRCFEMDLDEDDARWVEAMLLTAARDAGRTSEIAQKLTASLEATDARLAAKLLALAAKAVEETDYAEAISLAERALPLLKEPPKRAETAALIALWRTKTPR